ncbi:MAG TPA: class I SAM-dependent methyltransferase [Pyrinomonadaceae bacterium]|nr:class I SAM-dependent methyltransferase [Pyrinomonadaceae bacterium]
MREPIGRAFRKTQDLSWLARFGSQSSLVPPIELMHDGPQSYKEFKQNGEEFFHHYVAICGLRPDEHLLDVGSGIGRKTLPLVNYLNERGSYDGLELVKSGVDWCTEKYTSRYPNFRFHLIDVHNELYNPEGKYKATEYRFPFEDEQFDFVVLNSVFTHMIVAEVEHYMGEIARVLKTGGRCFISFFLLNEETLNLIAQGKNTYHLPYQVGPTRVASREKPELAIGFDEDYVEQLYDKFGLEIKRPIYYGAWSGRDEYLSYQDQIFAFKKTRL